MKREREGEGKGHEKRRQMEETLERGNVEIKIDEEEQGRRRRGGEV